MRGQILLAVLLVSAAPVAAQESAAAPPDEAGSDAPAARPPLVDLSDVTDPPEPAAAEPTPPNDPPAAEQPFAATLFLTHDYEGFIRAWVKGDEDALPVTTSIGLANPVSGMIAVSGCRPGPDGQCDLEVVTRTAGPDGTFDEPRPSQPMKAVPPPGGRRMLSSARFGLTLDRQDPPGRYTIEATVTDRIAGRSIVVAESAVKAASEAGR